MIQKKKSRGIKILKCNKLNLIISKDSKSFNLNQLVIQIPSKSLISEILILRAMLIQIRLPKMPGLDLIIIPFNKTLDLDLIIQIFLPQHHRNLKIILAILVIFKQKMKRKINLKRLALNFILL